MAFCLALIDEDWCCDVFHDPLDKVEVVICRLCITLRLFKTISISFELIQPL